MSQWSFREDCKGPLIKMQECRKNNLMPWWIKWHVCICHAINKFELDMSTARRRMHKVTRPLYLYIHPPHHGHTKVNTMVMNGWLESLSFHVNRPSHSWDKAISKSDLKTWRSMLWVWSKGVVMRPVQYLISRFFTFDINQTYNSWDRAISKFDLEKSKVKVMNDVKGRVHIVYLVSNRCTSFSFHINRTNHS